jgi:AraC family transcriptional regulator
MNSKVEKMIIQRMETFKETKLVGKKIRTTFAYNKTVELWRSFSPRRKEIKNSINTNLYSVELYPDHTFFENLNPMREYEKWAAVEVSEFDTIPDGMEKLIIPKGQYAVFYYKGKPSEAQETFRYIYGNWLPNSEYKMDERPYFALMGEKYKGESTESEEEFWIPIIRK